MSRSQKVPHKVTVVSGDGRSNTAEPVSVNAELNATLADVLKLAGVTVGKTFSVHDKDDNIIPTDQLGKTVAVGDIRVVENAAGS